MLLVVDNGSAYTGDLAGFLGRRGIPFERRDPGSLDPRSLGGFDSFILSGRRRNDKRTNMVNSRAVLHAVECGKKLLGICYGAEMLALALGGTIRRSAAPRRGGQKVTVLRPNPLCAGEVDVFESHAFEISALPGRLVPIAASGDCEHEMIRYGRRPIFGTQFHPEMSADGRRMIERFCRL